MLDLTSPDGTGQLHITSVRVEAGASTYDYEGPVEGPVEGYGLARASATLTHLDADETRGAMRGEARVLGNDGTLVAAAVCGTYRRKGTTIEVYLADSCSNGDMNFVTWSMDLMSKEVSVRYWSLG